ncbi:MAG: hypothetical protein JEZ09_09035 [Salinivirgaceae bacterium]|nr:hypothetical protein [Salinivirgaceae bacterium]
MNTPYPLLPVSVLITLAYFFSWQFYKWGIFTLKKHRKFWNILLLISFLICGLFGLISIIKINYKLDFPFYNSILKWHVIVGISFFLISFFHFLWHFKYFFSKPIPKQHKQITEQEIKNTYHKPDNIKYLLFLLGFFSITNQLVLIREFMSIFGGNELIIGVIIVNWLIITGWGAYSGTKQAPNLFSLNLSLKILVSIVLLPLLLTTLLYWLKSVLFPPGVMVNLESIFLGVFLLLFPVCFISGYLFTYFSSQLSSVKKQNLIGKSYAIESVGSLSGGLLFSLILGRFFTSYQIFGITICVVLFVCIWFNKNQISVKYLFLLMCGICLPIAIFFTNIEIQIKSLLLPNQTVILHRSTPYGSLKVTEQAGQQSFYENNNLLFYSENTIETEEAIHFAMAQHEQAKNILLISGGIAGMIDEIQKYKPQTITYLESNPEIVKFWKSIDEKNVLPENTKYVKADIRVFLSKNENKFDVIIINLPPPVTLGYNRFYTSEFFQIIKKHCTTNTIVCSSLPSTLNYAESNALELNAIMWNTLKQHFKNVKLIPGEKNYYIASNSAITTDILKSIKSKDISNSYINEYYYDAQLTDQRSAVLTANFEKLKNINFDFRPTMFFKQSNHWLSIFNRGNLFILIIPAIAFVFLFFKFDTISKGLYTGGFTSVSLEILLLLVYQIYFDSIYLETALFFAIFMAGLAVGSNLKHIYQNANILKQYAYIQLIIALLAILTPAVASLVFKISAYKFPAQLLLLFAVFTIACTIGYEFKLAAKQRQLNYQKTAGFSYGVDLLGSAFGAYFAPIVLLPIIGLFYTCLFLTFLNISSAFFAMVANKK